LLLLLGSRFGPDLLCCVVVVVTQVLEIWYLGKALIGCGWEGAAVAFIFGHQFLFSFLLLMKAKNFRTKNLLNPIINSNDDIIWV